MNTETQTILLSLGDNIIRKVCQKNGETNE